MVGRGSSKLELHKLREIDIARGGAIDAFEDEKAATGGTWDQGAHPHPHPIRHVSHRLETRTPAEEKACLKELYEEPLILNSFGNRATPRVGTISAQIAQGMSIDHLEVDLSNAFEPGQPYVALRCVYLIGFLERCA